MKEEKPMKIHNRIHKYKAEYYLGNKKITKKEYETSQNIIDLQAENTKLKEHLKRTHQIMTDMNKEIAKLKQEKEELEKKMYLIIMELYSENIINANIEEMRNILEKESDKDDC